MEKCLISGNSLAPYPTACPCSTEARRRNPDRGSGFVSQNLSFRVIPTFYPIALLREWGRCGKTSTVRSRTSCAEVGEQPSQEAANPPTGLGPACCGRFVQRVPAWGAFDWRQSEPDLEPGSGIPRQNGNANSSTMKGPQGLAGKYLERRCRKRCWGAQFGPYSGEKRSSKGNG